MAVNPVNAIFELVRGNIAIFGKQRRGFDLLQETGRQPVGMCLNEADEPRKVLAEALAMIEAAARFPWCKIAVSTRLEWLTIWSGKQTAQETSPLERARRCLYYDEARGRPDQPPEPVLRVEPFTIEQAEAVYGRYQAGAGPSGGYRVPACPTPAYHQPN